MPNKYLDVTPSWTGILPMLIHLLVTGNEKQVKVATEELQRMASLADEAKELWHKAHPEQMGQ